MELETAKQLCEQLMQKYNLGKVWKFEWMNSKRRTYGQCDKRKHLIRLSKYYILVNEEKFVRDTILHEIAHAKCHKMGHNKFWKEWCIKLGAIPKMYNEEKISQRNYIFAEVEGKLKAIKKI